MGRRPPLAAAVTSPLPARSSARPIPNSASDPAPVPGVDTPSTPVLVVEAVDVAGVPVVPVLDVEAVDDVLPGAVPVLVLDVDEEELDEDELELELELELLELEVLELAVLLLVLDDEVVVVLGAVQLKESLLVVVPSNVPVTLDTCTRHELKSSPAASGSAASLPESPETVPSLKAAGTPEIVKL